MTDVGAEEVPKRVTTCGCMGNVIGYYSCTSRVHAIERTRGRMANHHHCAYGGRGAFGVDVS